MCLIVTLVMLGLSIQSLMQHQYMAGTVQIIIALGFMLLLVRNIIAVRNQKQECGSTGCGMMGWLNNLLKKKED